MHRWSWAAAACRGTSHERSGVGLQDAQVSFCPNGKRPDVFVGIVSDGAGSASHGGEGAALACRTFSVSIRQHFERTDQFPLDSDLLNWLDALRDRIYVAAERRELTPRDFAATLVCAISDANRVLIAHVGDGSVVIKDLASQQWHAPSWPDHGEYASTTKFVTDEPAAQLRISNFHGDISAVVLFSDGLERLALDFASNTPFEKFFEGICRPLYANSGYGRNRSLSDELKRYLGSPRIIERTDDDKTLILAIPR